LTLHCGIKGAPTRVSASRILYADASFHCFCSKLLCRQPFAFMRAIPSCWRRASTASFLRLSRDNKEHEGGKCFDGACEEYDWHSPDAFADDCAQRSSEHQRADVQEAQIPTADILVEQMRAQHVGVGQGPRLESPGWRTAWHSPPGSRPSRRGGRGCGLRRLGCRRPSICRRR